MKFFFTFILIISIFNIQEPEVKNQKLVLQAALNIEEFQEHFNNSPRYVRSNDRKEVFMLDFPELLNDEIELTIRDKTIKFISENEIDEPARKYFIEVDEFRLNNKKASIQLSYQNAKMYHETKEKLILEVKLNLKNSEDWVIQKYELEKVSTNTSD
ncbi:hypothetical protein [Marivirga arenosa]|uniref:Uncharacterized protein n=1 Tax=Marivirga arenosa TaxID=3059076 RepID=A0AA52F198_9BACT|nr:hypothetical protein [Marivirga sp. BKB1-2]WNB18788.1 hypothetical protein QYS47_31380 [Marivirga sp. BKB1-2]